MKPERDVLKELWERILSTIPTRKTGRSRVHRQKVEEVIVVIKIISELKKGIK